MWGYELMTFRSTSKALNHYTIVTALIEGRLVPTNLKNKMNSSFSLNHPVVFHPILQIVVVQGIKKNAVPQTAATTFAF